jgi:multidrug resistance efflux pump
MKSKWIAILTAATLSMIACGRDDRAEDRRDDGPPVPVMVERVGTFREAAEFAATGTVYSRTVSAIAANVTGYVTRVPVREGDQVRAGALLVEIDDRDARARLARAEAVLSEASGAVEELERAIAAVESGREAAEADARLAEATFERFEELLARKSISRQEFDEVAARRQASQARLREAEAMILSIRAREGQVQARIRAAEAAVKEARLQLGYSRVAAPFAGVVTTKQVEIGQLALPGSPLLTLEDSRRFEVRAGIPEGRIGGVLIGQEVRVRIAALDTEVPGVVYEIIPRADPASRSVVVKVELPAVDGVRSGLYATTYFKSGETSALTVPEEALLVRGQLVGVYVVDNESRARFRLVRTGRRTAGRAEVLSGLSEGDRVVVDPGSEVVNGVSVEVSGSISGGGVVLDARAFGFNEALQARPTDGIADGVYGPRELLQ